MKKMLMCFIVAMLMILPLILTSCGDELTPEEIANANFQEADKALTLSMWLPVPQVDTDGDGVKDGLDSNFSTRLNAVEGAINDFLRSNNYCTELEIVAIDEKEYYSKLNERFESVKEAEKTNGKAYLTANKYVNHAVKNETTGIFEMAYPDVLDTQLDIFFVGDYENYVKYINSGDTYELNSFFTEGQVYNGLFKKIRSLFMDAVKVNNKYYAIPNNHVYADNGQYILVSKELYDANAGAEWNDSLGLVDLKEYIEAVGALGLENVVPFVGTTNDIPGVIFLDKDNLVASAASKSFEPNYLYDLSEYKTYMSFYKSLSAQSFAYDSLEEGKTAAVQVVSCSPLSLADYAEEYYIIETLPPFASVETLYSSMFAISSHSANFERSMQILYLLQTNEEVRTLLQYGIEGVDYEYGRSGDGKTVVSKNSGYTMSLLYTGNCYRTYPDNGESMSYWDSVKDLNLNVTLHPYLKYEAKFLRGEVSEEKMQELANYIALVSSDSQAIYSAFSNMTADEFQYIFDSFSYNLTQANRQLTRYQGNLETSTNNYNAAKEAYDNATDDEAKATAEADMAKYAAEIEENKAMVTRWEGIKSCVEKYADISTMIKDDNREELLDTYNSIYNSAK